MRMLEPNLWTEQGDHNGVVRGQTEGVQGTHRKNNNITRHPPSFQGLNHQPKNTHGWTHGSSYICSRGWPFWASKKGEALGPVKA